MVYWLKLIKFVMLLLTHFLAIDPILHIVASLRFAVSPPELANQNLCKTYITAQS